MRKYTALLLLACSLGPAVTSTAQDQPAGAGNQPLIIEPLFEYPAAPEDMEGLEERANYLMEHFWDPMDFKSKSTVDQNALNDAFEVYTAPMRFASEQAVEASLTKLISKIEKNPALSLQFAKSAEEALYGQRAYLWNDQVFLRFIDNVLKSKQIKKERKLRYQQLGTQLRNTLRGTIPPEFDYQTVDGRRAHYHPNGVVTVIEFGDPDCDDCRLAKLKMETNVRFSSLVERGKVNVLFIYVDPEEDWQQKLAGYPDNWHVGASEDVTDIYDVRLSPSIYVIDREGKIAAKNISVESAMEIVSAVFEGETDK